MSGSCDVYDGVAICSGNFNKPVLPTNIDLEQFTGTTLHSMEYNDAEEFAGKRVMVVGSGSSGIDITCELSKYTSLEDLIINHRQTEPLLGLSNHVRQISCGITEIRGNDISFADGSVVKVDVIICATGYRTDLSSILHPTCKLSDKAGVVVFPLYKYLLNPYFPTMALFGKTFRIAPFILSEYQAVYFSKVLQNDISLPSTLEMLTEAHKLLLKYPERREIDRYTLESDQFQYYDELSVDIGEHFYDHQKLLCIYKTAVENRTLYPSQYRDSLEF